MITTPSEMPPAAPQVEAGWGASLRLAPIIDLENAAAVSVLPSRVLTVVNAMKNSPALADTPAIGILFELAGLKRDASNPARFLAQKEELNKLPPSGTKQRLLAEETCGVLAEVLGLEQEGADDLDEPIMRVVVKGGKLVGGFISAPAQQAATYGLDSDGFFVLDTGSDKGAINRDISTGQWTEAVKRTYWNERHRQTRLLRELKDVRTGLREK